MNWTQNVGWGPARKNAWPGPDVGFSSVQFIYELNRTEFKIRRERPPDRGQILSSVQFSSYMNWTELNSNPMRKTAWPGPDFEFSSVQFSSLELGGVRKRPAESGIGFCLPPARAWLYPAPFPESQWTTNGRPTPRTTFPRQVAKKAFLRKSVISKNARKLENH